MKKEPAKRLQNPDFDRRKEVVLIYTLAVLAGLGISLFAGLIGTTVKNLNPFSLSIIAVILSTWYGGFRAGLISFVVSYITYLLVIYFFSTPEILLEKAHINTTVEMTLIALNAMLVSFLIDKAKKMDHVSQFKTKIYELTKKIVKEQKANIEAKEEIKARDEFLSIASHELKTPLTLVLLQIQNALHNIKNVSLANFSVGKLLEMLESVEQQTGRLSRMIGDLLNVSLITRGKLNLEIEKTDLTKIVKDVCKRLPEALSKKKYPISVNAKDTIIGNWDKIRIEQAVVNLISNAIKYGNNKPVEVKVQKFNGIAKLIIIDRGIGIPKEVKDKIFERFERGGVSKSYQGLGVGLYITNQIIVAHNGKIKVESQNGKGSTFTVELPIKGS